MAAIVRVKRRLDEDPANSLLLSCKRLRPSHPKDVESQTDANNVQSLFKFAGTLPSKQNDVTVQVRNAIRREKLQKEYKRHQVDISAISRQSHSSTAIKNRFKIVASRRAIDLDSLDKDNSESCDNQVSQDTTKASFDSNVSLDTSSTCDKVPGEDKTSQNVIGQKSEIATNSIQSEATPDDSSQSASSMFCLYDIEEEPPDSQPSVTMVEPPEDAVTCNGVAMVRRKVVPGPPTEQYVYDIYYMNSAGFDFHSLENILEIEALRGDLALDHGGKAEDCGEDEDSNDEDHWRNDYPDEEGTLGTQTIDFAGHPEHTDTESDEDYEADYGMSSMLTNRLRICDSGDSLSSEGEDFTYFNQPIGGVLPWTAKHSYDSYKAEVLRELKQDYGEDDAT